jgi:hypothetical protein
MGKSLKFSVKNPLNHGDSESQTFGCRHKDPDFCKHIDSKEFCAFVRNDSICMKPSTTWKKHYFMLIESQQKNE